MLIEMLGRFYASLFFIILLLKLLHLYAAEKVRQNEQDPNRSLFILVET